MNELSIFSGAGGGLLASILKGWRAIGYVEKDEFCQRVLRQRIADGYLPDAPLFSDIRAFIREGYAEQYQGVADVVSGGFPCQAFSTAARGGNIASKNLWPETIEVVRRVRPRWCFFENVTGVQSYLPVVYEDLVAEGYTVRKSIRASAASVGAPHLRRRVWILAHRNDEAHGGLPFDAKAQGPPTPQRAPWWESFDSSLLGVDDGVATRVDRFRATGNGQVPAVARLVLEYAMQGRG